MLRRLAARTRWPLLSGGRFAAEPSVRWWPELATRSRHGAYLHGYWQSERYFAHQASAVRQAYTWRGPLEAMNAHVAQQILKAQDSISVHVRRGDYVKSKKNQEIYAACTVAYYESAIERLRAGSKGQVFAFSDDPDWVMQTLAPRVGNLTLVDHNRGEHSHFDMRLMSMCRHHVIANSSFSWWAAWLDDRPGAQVIAPSRWYANGTDDSDLLPARWQRL